MVTGTVVVCTFGNCCWLPTFLALFGARKSGCGDREFRQYCERDHARSCNEKSYLCIMTRTPTRRLADVARKVGGSEATVSRVLNGKAGRTHGQAAHRVDGQGCGGLAREPDRERGRLSRGTALRARTRRPRFGGPAGLGRNRYAGTGDLTAVRIYGMCNSCDSVQASTMHDSGWG